MSLPAVPKLPQASGKQTWHSLYGSSRSLLLALATTGRQQLSVLITDNSQNARLLQDELSFFAPDLPVVLFPDWEILPYDLFSPHQDIISQRIAALYQLPHMQQGVLIVPTSTALQRLAPKEFLLGGSLMLDTGQTLDIENMRGQLQAAGYHCVDTVYEHGEFAVRGSLLDLYPMGSERPYRIDLFDNEIETLRTFDPETQRSTDQVDSIRLLPAREFPFDSDSRKAFRNRFRERFDTDFRRCPIFQDISNGILASGIEIYLPLFFEHTSTLFDYLPDGCLLFTLPGIEQAANSFWQDVRSRHEDLRGDIERPLLPPAELYLPVEDFFASIKQHPRIELDSQAAQAAVGRTNLPTAPLPVLTLNARAHQPLAGLQSFTEGFDGRILFTAETAGRREILLELLERIELTPHEVAGWPEFLARNEPLCICIAPLTEGLLLDTLAVIPESALLGQRISQRQRRDKASEHTSELVIRNLTELREGAPVVHIDHGVGRYRGLTTLTVDGQATEFLQLEYAEQAKLYVPVAHLHLIARYSGSDDDGAPLHRLGSDQWSKAKRKAAEQVRDVAAELLDIYARRAARKGHAFGDPGADYATFSAAFPYEETPDQQLAIDAVRRDMLAGTPMDRLICGDVGFGKTEVAMRAAFIAVHSGKQVAVLAPTTLLAQQHYNSFRDRFADWPVKVEVMSRFSSAKETKAALEQLKQGKLDIVIGTHKLLQDDVRFDNLGLVIIDEEHRFGVRQKERLKALRSEVDILTLTATPIPRTLNMAFSNLRDLSIIATPPARRLSVRTFVMPRQDAIVKEALLRELLRGGQVYYLHNDVKTIDKCAEELAKLVPEARIGVGHGQMRERELEQVMADFYHKRTNVLVATTIIETGIDVPSANTILIDRADKFGLAQLHQLRGRVGRSHHQAYAYLLVPSGKKLTTDAEKRLEAISNAQDLGAGFVLATHDLEIRGAGELLGDGQSGQIQSVGFSLYMDMLERAVQAIKDGKEPDLEQATSNGAQVSLRIPALIPDDYLPDVHNRLMLYKRIASAPDEDALKDLQVEMIDRFGLLPPPAKNLFAQASLKLRADQLGIVKLDANDEGGRLEFSTSTPVDPVKLIKLIQSQPKRYRFEGATVFRFNAPMDTPAERFAMLDALLDQLSN